MDPQIESTTDAKQDAMRHDITDAAMSSQGMMKNKVGGWVQREIWQKKWSVAGQGPCLHAQELELCSLFVDGRRGQS